jgi:H-NS histone family
MTIRILRQGNGAISGRHYKPKPQIVTRTTSVFLAMSGAMRDEVRTIGSSAAARLALSISGCVVGMGKSNLRRQARSESALSCSRKYRNPERPSETWVGRGKKSRWLAAHLKSGKRIDDFRISHAARRQISWPDWLRLSEPAYAMPAPRPAVWRGLRPLHGVASVRLRDLVWFCCALLSPPSWLRLPEVLPAVQMLPYRGGG